MSIRRSAAVFVSLLMITPLVAACTPTLLAAPFFTAATSTMAMQPSATPSLPSPSPQPTQSSSPTAQPSLLPTPTESASPLQAPEPATKTAANPTPLTQALDLDPADWKNWPVLPGVPERIRDIYQIGQGLGNNPNAFSILGDCQSEPQVFMGAFETDPTLFASLPLNLQETVAWFVGSFNRESPTAQSGTTAGAELWPPWHKNQFTCASIESPLQCELRIHHPAFAIIQLGTHYEDRNQDYMRRILDQLIAAGVVPILATKADDDELDYHINTQYAELAVEYQIPFWNFWAAVKDLPWHGLTNRPGLAFQGDIYLTDPAVVIHRMTALESLDLVRRAVTGP